MKGLERIKDLPKRFKVFILEAFDKFEAKARFYNRSQEPWKAHHIAFLIERLIEELHELLEAQKRGDMVNMRDEALDITNFAWFIYERAGDNIAKETPHETDSTKDD
jgi:NTP pyrophosphatase (non-canonical NTP hydrolase)